MNELAHTSALSRWFNGNGWRQVIIATPYLWLFVFFFIPFLIIVWISLGKTYPTSPPFSVFAAMRQLATSSIADSMPGATAPPGPKRYVCPSGARSCSRPRSMRASNASSSRAEAGGCLADRDDA